MVLLTVLIGLNITIKIKFFFNNNEDCRARSLNTAAHALCLAIVFVSSLILNYFGSTGNLDSPTVRSVSILIPKTNYLTFVALTLGNLSLKLYFHNRSS
jgi:hypothetical protein